MSMQPETAIQMCPNAIPEAQPACAHCRAPFTPMRAWQRFCSPACKSAYHRSPEALIERIDALEKRIAALERARV